MKIVVRAKADRCYLSDLDVSFIAKRCTQDRV